MNFKNSQKGSPRSSEAGFSAIGLFLLGLTMIFVMNMAGIFKVPESEVTDKTPIKATGASSTSKNSLSISTLLFGNNPTLTIPTAPPQSQKPPNTNHACGHNTNRPVPPETCGLCPGRFVKCVNAKCEEYNESKSSLGRNSGTNQCEYMNKNNWCAPPFTVDRLDGWYCIGKPVIYLYPEFPMHVDVSIKTAGEVVVSIPEIENLNNEQGWTDVLAHPSGILFYKNGIYRELFYETAVTEVNQPKNGFVISQSELETKLLEFIKRLGLTRKDEQDEFMDWWIPRLESYDSPYWYISIIDQDEKQKNDKVMIDPKPDTFIEFIVYFKPLDEFENVKPLELPETPKRIGFTAVEWGGVIDELRVEN